MLRVKFNEVVEVIRIKYEDLNEMSTKSNYCDNLIISEKKIDMIKEKDKMIETDFSDNNFYDLTTNEMFDVYRSSGVNYSYI
jgi:hypothetical protein